MPTVWLGNAQVDYSYTHGSGADPSSLVIEWGSSPGVYTSTYQIPIANVPGSSMLLPMGITTAGTYYMRARATDGAQSWAHTAEQTVIVETAYTGQSRVILFVI